MISNVQALTLAVLLSTATYANPVHAERVDQEKIVECILGKTRPEEKEIFRHFMISALQGERREFERNTQEVESALTRIATKECGMTTEDMDTPAFSQIMESYFEKIGNIIWDEAVANQK